MRYSKKGGTKMLGRIWQAAVAAAVIAGASVAATAQTQGTIKIGVLHSLSGTMAISETTLMPYAQGTQSRRRW